MAYASDSRPQLPLLRISPEQRMVTALCRPQPRSEQVQTAQEQLPVALDWEKIIEMARAHAVAPLCFARLSLLSDLPPASALASLRTAVTMTAARNLRLVAKLLEIAERAEAEGLLLAPYKGPALAEMAYGNVGLRESVDLDFILPHDHLIAAWKLLESLGYRPRNPALAAPGAPVPGEYVFLSDENGAQVELHTEYTLRHFPSPPSLAPLFAARAPLALAGRRVLMFSREDALTLLAVHGAKDFWVRLLWICDIAWLVAAPGFDWGLALDRADGMRCRRMVNVALLLASELLEARIPEQVLSCAQADVGATAQVRWLAPRILDPRPLSRSEQIRYRMRMVNGLLPGIRYAARLATTPAADDWDALRLPTPLGFAYALLRPLRLFRR